MNGNVKQAARRLAVANGPHIFQMLLVVLIAQHIPSSSVSLSVRPSEVGVNEVVKHRVKQH